MNCSAAASFKMSSSEASPQTDETCDGGGSGRRYMTRIWWNQPQLGPMNGLHAYERQNLHDRSQGDDSA
jgi:hypothetical protein